MENSHKQDSIDSAIASNIAEIVDKITDRLNRGERPNLDEFAQGDKQLRRALQQIVNTLSLLREPDSACPSNGDQPTSTGQLGDFRILQEIGRGGMGVVYEAEQISIGRRVALKVLPFAAMLDKQQLNRFKNEARAAGTLNHPNIVAVHAVGTERGVHYYAMQLIEGQSLAEVIAQRRCTAGIDAQGNGDEHARSVENRSTKQSQADSNEEHSTAVVDTQPLAALSTDSESNPQAHYRMVARLGIQAAEALEHAHRNGIVHRDVKPGNLLLDVDDNLYVTDFGLARLEADAGMTMTGDLLGTLPYMSPEQALAKRTIVDHRADVYSLGVTLYELVTLQKPYDGRDRQELLKKIAFEEPRRLRQINRCVSEDLETIIAKAIEKDPADRYASAQGLADDLRRYLNHEPIRARPPTVGDRFAKWSRRNVGILWVITAALAVVAVVCSVGALVLSASYREANRQRDLAHQEARTTRQLLYSADVRMAYDAWNAERLNLVRDLLARHIPNPTEEDLREFSWHYLWNLSHGGKRKLVAHEQDVFSIAYSPDGTTVATASKDGTAKLWNATTWELQHVLAGHESEVTAVRFSPTGEQVATASEDHTVRIWEVATGEELAVLANHTDDVLALDFSPDGALLASGGRDLQVRVWNAKSWKLARTLPAATNDIHSLRFSPDSAILVAGDADGAIHRWGVSDWTALPLMGSELSRPESEEKIFSLDCSPDSNWLAAAGRLGEVHVWKLGRDTPELQSSRHGHNGWIQSVAFSPLGDKVASGGRDGIIKIWNTHRQSDPPITLLGHTARVWSVAWSPDGRRLASAGADGTVIVWDVAHPAYSLTRTVSFPNAIGAAVISPNGQTVITGSDDGVIRILDRTTLTVRALYPLHQRRIARIVHSPVGQLVASRSWDGTTKLWDEETGRVKFTKTTALKGASALAFSPDGATLATVDDRMNAVLLDVETFSERRRFPHPNFVGGLKFSPDGRTLATGSDQLRLWDASTGRLVRGQPPGGNIVYSHDGATIAMCGVRIHLRDAETGEVRHTLIGHSDGIVSLAFTPDDRMLASGSHGGRVKFWDMRTFQELATFSVGDYEVCDLSFSTDGKTLIAACTSDNGGQLVEWSFEEREHENGQRSPPDAE